MQSSHDFQSSSSSKKSPIKLMIMFILIVAIVTGSTIYYLTRDSIASTIVSQLNTIKRGDYKLAYEMTSQAFKDATTYDVFESYVKSNPIFNDYKRIQFTNEQREKSSAYLKGILEGEDGGQMNIEYQMLLEKGKWHIQAIRLTPIGVSGEPPMQTTENEKSTVASIHGIMINDEADADGYVDDNKNILSSAAKKIFVTVMLVAPKPDINVSTMLVYLDKNIKLGPIESKTTKTGNIMKAFSFTRDGSAWPTGNYEAQVSLSTGDKQIIKFEIK